MYIGGIEAGGTKINCAIGTTDGKIIEQTQFPTTSPEETAAKMLAYFRDKEISALGVASFGPIDINPSSPTYGSILDTPKSGWAHYNLIQTLKTEIKVPIVFDTDVNGAALAESYWGAAKNLSSCVYLTIGTGIGGGACIDGKLIHGLLHPEMGHIYVRRHPHDHYQGTCPFHHDCLEGLAAGPSIQKRLGISGAEIAEDHAVWDYISYYLAQAILNYTMILSPEVILLGGGVMKQQHLFHKIRQQFQEILADYIHRHPLPDDLESYIRFPELGDFAGLYGSLALALQK
ncbi:ROK family protein [Clostridiales bacterium COT073_COT-073]|nr:ROK family protein [Clostridiales bacterium COT073_COT-073]